ncbi:LuxR C-terminal-related transcriptional regulator [Microvirga sp. G4-2]|uniref:LuxR C-terminal-related transcriptional regulator n=1 Tax=Microvirga sp. G4-2 TaxID=3434467 RepID=UPI0040450809
MTTILFCRNPLIGIGLKHLLADTCFAISGIASDEISLSRCCELTPDLFIIDGNDAAEQVIETVRNLKSHHPATRVVVVAEAFDLNFVRLGRDAGLDGFCSSAVSGDVLIKTLELVMLGEAILPAALIAALLDRSVLNATPERHEISLCLGLEPSDPKARTLSTREAEILMCLTQGAPNKIIARKLDVAEATVKVHVKAILRKIGAANRTQAAMWATTHLPARGDADLGAGPNQP